MAQNLHFARTATSGVANRRLSPLTTFLLALAGVHSHRILSAKMSFLRLAVRNAVARPQLSMRAFPSTPSRVFQLARYSAAASLSKDDISQRVLGVLKGFEKVDQSKASRTYGPF